MNYTLKHLIDRAMVSMPVTMILIAGTLTKTGHPDWGLAWIAGLSALLLAADVFDAHERASGVSVTSPHPLPDRS